MVIDGTKKAIANAADSKIRYRRISALRKDEIRNEYASLRIYSKVFSDHFNDFKNYCSFHRYLVEIKSTVTVLCSFTNMYKQTMD